LGEANDVETHPNVLLTLLKKAVEGGLL